MASQVVTTNLEVLHINSYISGYHAYMGVWTPVLDEMLILKREPTNVADKSAVAVYKEDVDVVVGHVPFNLASSISKFLKRDINKAFAKVVGQKGSTDEQDMDWRSRAYTLSMDPSLTREDEGAGRVIGCKRTALKARLECQHD